MGGAEGRGKGKKPLLLNNKKTHLAC
jgi:hypothetical protein